MLETSDLVLYVFSILFRKCRPPKITPTAETIMLHPRRVSITLPPLAGAPEKNTIRNIKTNPLKIQKAINRLKYKAITCKFFDLTAIQEG